MAIHYDTETTDPEILRIKEEAETYTKWIFSHHDDKTVRAGKVIHDCVWGTHRFEDFEIALINTPLVQRLRQVHQTANTFLIYPSTTHTRFEHTIGVTAQVGKLIKSLEEKFKSTKGSSNKSRLIDGLATTLRIAAILHDSGHGPCSHTSEEIYGTYPEIKKLKRIDPFKSAGPGEILSYIIIKTDAFKNTFLEIKKKYSINVDDDLIGNAIVGYVNSPENQYKIDILNGPFDADKIDYLFRDGHFSGLPLQIDLDRLWYAIDINQVGDRRRLTIDWGGVSSLEQILFSKMTLYPAVYHHHKVRACDCMFKGIIEYIKENNMSMEREHKDGKIINFNRAIDFLYFTDYDFYSLALAKKDNDLHNLLHNLQYRRLLKRAIVISRDTIRKECGENLKNLIKYRNEPTKVGELEFYRWLAKMIKEEAKLKSSLQEIWVDCPDDPSFEEANDTWISPLGKEQDPLPLSEFFKTEQYANQYKHRKWRGHVFCKAEDVDKVATACVTVFKRELDIEFKELAFQLCHIDPPSNLKK